MDRWLWPHLEFFLSQQLAKIDVVSRKHLEWKQELCFPSEPVFVASPGAVEEDDGEAFTDQHRWFMTMLKCAVLRRGHFVIGHLFGSKGLPVHAHPGRKNIYRNRPSLHPRQRPPGPSRTFHSWLSLDFLFIQSLKFTFSGFSLVTFCHKMRRQQNTWE